MQIIQKYLVREVVMIFCMALAAVVSIYLVVDFFEKVDDFLEAGIPISRAFVFFGLRIFFVIAQVTPVAVLLAVLIVLGLMARNNELIALKSSGIGTRYLLTPLVFLGVGFSILLFFLAEIIVPITVVKANHIWNVEVRKQIATFRQKNIWIKGHRAIYHVAYFNPADETIAGVSFNFFDDQFKIAKHIDADKGIYKDGKWILTNCLEQVRLKDGTYKVTCPSQIALTIDLEPDSLKKVAKRSDEMTLTELSAYIQKVENEGYDATPYRVDWHAKLAFPAVCLIMIIVGTAIALRNKKGEGIAIGVTYGIGIAFCYWVINSLCLSLAYNGLLRPSLAPWLTNMIFASLGILLLIYVD
ncbi:MAG: LPS export ABC transporter permease LptG [Desulfobacteria bacterium]